MNHWLARDTLENIGKGGIVYATFKTMLLFWKTLSEVVFSVWLDIDRR